MRILIATAGSHGDVVPYTGLGARLREAGHVVSLATHTRFAALVGVAGLEFRALPVDPMAALTTEGGQRLVRARSAALEVAELIRLGRQLMPELGEGVLSAAQQGCDVLLLSATLAPLGQVVAEALGLPSIGVFLQPMTPTREFQAPVPITRPLGPWGNYLVGNVTQSAIDQLLYPAVRQLRRRLGLPALTIAAERRRAGRRGWPVLHGFSPAVVARPADWRAGMEVCGYWWPHQDPAWQSPAQLIDFLQAGPPPVFVGFGSRLVPNVERLSAAVGAALRQAGVRAIVQAGWSGLSVTGDDVLTVDEVPHHWLFPQMAAVVHHCGAGTTAAGLRAGIPAIPLPAQFDTPFWAARLTALGVAGTPIPARTVSRPAGSSAPERDSGTRLAPPRATARHATGHRGRRRPRAPRGATGRRLNLTVPAATRTLGIMSVAAQSLLEFDHSYARELPRLSKPWTAASVPAPALLMLNEELATELGADAEELRKPAGVALLVGNAIPDGVRPVAQAYAGHQFGGYVPRLGDGRALLLGELLDRGGRRRDVHLKGSGRTPFARGADGKAAVGPMLREYVIGEAMHALGIPTSRALAVVATGEQVVRETRLPGAVLARVAASHLRVGTFQYAAASGDPALVRKLADYAIARHHPDAAEAENPYLEFYRRVIDVQASLVAGWMLVGFVHGVMNTDNMTISGESIDYGPCAFMDHFDPATVFSSIDHGGRYAYGNQPGIAQWNLAQLGETLLPLIDGNTDAAVEAAADAVSAFAERYEGYWTSGMAAKLGLDAPDQSLIQDLLALLHAQRVDFTQFFRALSSHLRGDSARSLFTEPEAFDAWAGRWQALLPADRDAVTAAMDRVNPVYIPRNHLVEEALTAATDGDMAPFRRLVEVVTRPFSQRPGLEPYAEPAPASYGPHVTYCGT